MSHAAPKPKKPKFPFWVLRLTNVQLIVLTDSLALWLGFQQGRQVPEEAEAAAHLFKAVQTTAAKRLERSRAKKEPT